MPKNAFCTFLILSFLISSCNLFTSENDEKIKANKASSYLLDNQSGRSWKEKLNSLDSFYAIAPKTKWNKYYHYYHSLWLQTKIENYQSAILYADSALELLKDKPDIAFFEKEYIDILTQKGSSYFNLHDYSKSYENYFLVYQAATKISDSCSHAIFMQNLGITLYKQKKFEESISYYKKLVSLLNEGCTAVYPYSGQEYLDNIALAYEKLKNYDSSVLYFNKALNWIERNKYLQKDTTESLKMYASCKGVVIGNMARVYLLRRDTLTAETLYKKAIYLNSKLGNERADAQLCQQQLAQIYLNNQKLSEFKNSADSLRKSLDTLPNETAEMGWRKMMADYYGMKSNTAFELKFYKSYIDFRDSLNQKQSSSQYDGISAALKDKEQQFEIELLQKDNQLKKLSLVVAVSLSLFVFAVAIFVYRSFHRTKKTNKILNDLNTQIVAQKESLEKANKAKDKIMNVVAHDLRNPISGIHSVVTRIMKNETDHNQDLKEALSMVQRSASFSLALISELLESNRQLKLVKTDFDLNEQVSQSINLFVDIMKQKNQQLEIQLNSVPIIIEADADKISRVIQNLIHNAIKFTPNKGIINIKTELAKDARFIITDSGIGVPDEKKEDIFNLFSNFSRQGTGGEKSFGIGLSVCKEIINEHGGKIWVESQQNSGSKFLFTLPLATT